MIYHSSIEIVPFVIEDELSKRDRDFAALLNAAYRADGAIDAADDSVIAQRFDDIDDANAYAIRQGAAIVGGFTCRQDTSTLWLEALAVNPAHRSLGLGAIAIRYLDMSARHHDLLEIRANVQPNPRSIAFYEQNGFSVDSESGSFIQMAKPIV